MKTLFLMLITISFLFSGCSKNKDVLPSNENTPSACLDANRFNNKEALFASVVEMKNNPGSDENNLKELNYYFEPEDLPEGFTLYEIAVKSSYCCLTYLKNSSEESINDFYNRIDFEYYRFKTDDHLKNTLESMKSPDGIYSEFDNNAIHYYYIKVTNPFFKSDGTLDETAPGVDVCYMVFWVQDGSVFHVNAPLWFTEEDIAKYCRARKIIIYD